MVHHTFHIELDLKPTDENYGNDLEEEQTLLQATLQRDVPWTYSRMHVPTEFARNGIELALWRQAVDSASQLWKDRTVALATPAQAVKRICATLAVFVVSIPFITLIILISSIAGNRNGYLPEWSGFAIIGAIVSYIVSFAVSVSVDLTFIHQYTNVLSEFEQKWSSLAQDLNAEYELRGVKVETVRKHVLKRRRKLAWTVGLGFQFRMQPVDDEEVAWCMSNSQTSDVDDDAYQDRKLRVIKETPLSHDGVDVVLGDQQSGVAVAIAVVDDVDVENSRNVGIVNEKAALLNLV